MQTSLQWWNKTKSNPDLLINWLKNQYHGERTAAVKIRELFLTEDINLSEKEEKLILQIAKEEDLHADWVAKLLQDRGVSAEILDKESRYWDKVLDNKKHSKEELAAIANLAENMRLERIKVIAEDSTADADIRAVFKKILPMEVKHEHIFGSMTNRESIIKALSNHEDGLNELGLVL